MLLAWRTYTLCLSLLTGLFLSFFAIFVFLSLFHSFPWTSLSLPLSFSLSWCSCCRRSLALATFEIFLALLMKSSVWRQLCDVEIDARRDDRENEREKGEDETTARQTGRWEGSVCFHACMHAVEASFAFSERDTTRRRERRKSILLHWIERRRRMGS